MFLLLFSKTIREDGVVFGWLYVDDEVRFQPGRTSRGAGARSFRLAAGQLGEGPGRRHQALPAHPR
ncbi:MAG: hypothetical protein GEV03_22605 [Streptosporangiales bacterium]|nr:hypothetical protein [Streptosporangiales bacterium]